MIAFASRIKSRLYQSRIWASLLLVRPWRSALIMMLVFAALTAIVEEVVVGDSRHPLLGTRSDGDQWVFQGYYFATHLKFTPLPQLELTNNDVFYPYGVSNVFRPWQLESSYFYAVGYQLFGNGPWIQWHFLISMFACATLIYLVVGNEFGRGWGSLAAFALAFGNFYALGRFPDHYGYSAVHWMTLSILLDFIILRRFALEREITLQLLLLKCLVQALCFGQDLGYICGISLTSSSITVVWLCFIALIRCGLATAAWRSLFADFVLGLLTSARKHKLLNLGLAASFLLASALYIPIVLQVFRAAHEEVRGPIPGVSVYSVSRDNFLKPIWPLGGAREHRRFIGNYFACRPGSFFLGAATVGLLGGLFYRRSWLVTLPFLLLIALFLTLDLEPVMQAARWLPWMAHVRVPDHFTVALPVLLLVIAMQLPARFWQPRWGKALAGMGIGLLVVEVATAYSHLEQYGNHGRFRPDPTLLQLADTIYGTPGEALMEWPFTVMSGNEVGNSELGVYLFQQTHSMALQAFHRKKVVGSYLGRMHPNQMAPFLDAGWHMMFLPASPEIALRSRQHRDFTEEEWAFFHEFVRKNDFCGVLVYPDLLHPDTVQRFEASFGPPASSKMHRSGELLFFAKPAGWRAEVDVAAGRRLKFRPPLLSTTNDQPVSFQGNAHVGLLKAGWCDPEPTGRSSQGPCAELAFSLVSPSQYDLVLDLELHAFQGQPFHVKFNGRKLGSQPSPPDAMARFRFDVPAELVREANLLRIETPSARGKGGLRGEPGVHLKSVCLRQRTGRSSLEHYQDGDSPRTATRPRP